MGNVFIIIGVLVVLLVLWFVFRGTGTKPVDDEPDDN